MHIFYHQRIVFTINKYSFFYLPVNFCFHRFFFTRQYLYIFWPEYLFEDVRSTLLSAQARSDIFLYGGEIILFIFIDGKSHLRPPFRIFRMPQGECLPKAGVCFPDCASSWAGKCLVFSASMMVAFSWITDAATVPDHGSEGGTGPRDRHPKEGAASAGPHWTGKPTLPFFNSPPSKSIFINWRWIVEKLDITRFVCIFLPACIQLCLFFSLVPFCFPSGSHQRCAPSPSCFCYQICWYFFEINCVFFPYQLLWVIIVFFCLRHTQAYTSAFMLDFIVPTGDDVKIWHIAHTRWWTNAFLVKAMHVGCIRFWRNQP